MMDTFDYNQSVIDLNNLNDEFIRLKDSLSFSGDREFYNLVKITKLFLNLEKNEKFSDFIKNIISPDNFDLMTLPELSSSNNHKGHEIWTDSKCIFIDEKIFKKINKKL
jgi:hypothetical protein